MIQFEGQLKVSRSVADQLISCNCIRVWSDEDVGDTSEDHSRYIYCLFKFIHAKMEVKCYKLYKAVMANKTLHMAYIGIVYLIFQLIEVI